MSSLNNNIFKLLNSKKLKIEQKKFLNQDYFFACSDHPEQMISLDEVLVVLTTPIFPKFCFKSKNSPEIYIGLGQLDLVKHFNTQEKNTLINHFKEQFPDYPIFHHQFFNEGATLKSQNIDQDLWISFESTQLIIPKILFKYDYVKKSLFLLMIDENLSFPFLESIEAMLKQSSMSTESFSSINKNKKLKNEKINPEYGHWEKSVDKIIDNINNQKETLKKLVLSRKKIKHYENNLSTLTFLLEETITQQNSYFIFVEPQKHVSFTSITPECLFKVTENNLYTDAIAGTRKKSESKIENEKIIHELLNSFKDLEEHQVVSDYIYSILNTYFSNKKINRLKSNQILELKSLFHLHSQFSVNVDQDFNFLDFIKVLHPTPAVGGFPKKNVLKKIENFESFTRGLFAAPAGIVTSKFCDFAVCLRCALIKENQIHFFAGCGIVSDSNAHLEWVETENKMSALENYLC